LIRDNIDIEMINIKGTGRYKKLKKLQAKVCQNILITQEEKIKRKEKENRP
jgi:hypothetical protein